jgi:hypothetical protein
MNLAELETYIPKKFDLRIHVVTHKNYLAKLGVILETVRLRHGRAVVGEIENLLGLEFLEHRIDYIRGVLFAMDDSQLY